jgi:hypothetical protein
MTTNLDANKIIQHNIRLCTIYEKRLDEVEEGNIQHGSNLGDT